MKCLGGVSFDLGMQRPHLIGSQGQWKPTRHVIRRPPYKVRVWSLQAGQNSGHRKTIHVKLLNVKVGDLLSGGNRRLLYKEVVEILVNLSTWARCNIAHAVMQFTPATSAPRDGHMVAAKRVLRYFTGKSDTCLIIISLNFTTRILVVCELLVIDDLNTSRSVSGDVFLLVHRSRMRKPISGLSVKHFIGDIIKIST